MANHFHITEWKDQELVADENNKSAEHRGKVVEVKKDRIMIWFLD